MKLDFEDWLRVKDLTSYSVYSKCNNQYYVLTQKHVNPLGVVINKKPLHNLIMNAPKGLVIDHKNHDTLDNRRSNLRICTRAQNNQNRIYKKPLKYKYKCVSKSNDSRFFKYRIQTKDKRLCFSGFETAKEAALAYNQKAIELFGEFAQLNVIDD